LALDVKSSVKIKKNIIALIRAKFNIALLENSNIEKLKSNYIDIAIHLIEGKNKYNRQDLDNVQKIVFDALKKDTKNSKWNYLIEDDRQIERCLVLKTLKSDESIVDIVISFREHDLSKQMIMKRREGMKITISTQ